MSDVTHKKTGSGALFLGFIASLCLTIAAFKAVELHWFGNNLFMAVVLLALIQVIVQVRCSFRLNVDSDKTHWNMVLLIFTGIVLAIVVVGSLWIMHNLNVNMMDHSMKMMTQK